MHHFIVVVVTQERDSCRTQWTITPVDRDEVPAYVDKHLLALAIVVSARAANSFLDTLELSNWLTKTIVLVAPNWRYALSFHETYLLGLLDRRMDGAF